MSISITVALAPAGTPRRLSTVEQAYAQLALEKLAEKHPDLFKDN